MPLTTINGHQHFYEDTGSGDAVVLLHGNENSSYYFKRIIPALSDEFHVIAPHFRGMGFSEHVQLAPPAPGLMTCWRCSTNWASKAPTASA